MNIPVTFNARADKCPICHKWFRDGCNHSVLEARKKLIENYIKSIIRKEDNKK